MNLWLAMGTDRILGEEANYIRAICFVQLLHEVDRKENKTTWNIQKALRECIDSAFLVWSRFDANYLESWHLLIAMANHSHSVAGQL